MAVFGDSGYPLILLWGVTKRFGESGDYTDRYSQISYSDKTISWYSLGVNGQFNYKGTVYKYVVIG